jgi:uncharacterized protein YlbG (UPF0298 family)
LNQLNFEINSGISLFDYLNYLRRKRSRLSEGNILYLSERVLNYVLILVREEYV